MLKLHSASMTGTLVALSLVQPVTAAHKFPDYPVRPAGDYAVKTEKSGLTLGVQPVEDLKDQETFFDTKLTPKGFLPVFVVIENESSVDSFLFEKTNVGYAGVSNGSKANAGTTFGTEVQENILKKGIQSRTLSPGTSVHGFLYIPVPKKGPREKIHLQVPITKAATRETYVLNLYF
jgi:hypothetical protein